jgi:hypothetical protein
MVMTMIYDSCTDELLGLFLYGISFVDILLARFFVSRSVGLVMDRPKRVFVRVFVSFETLRVQRFLQHHKVLPVRGTKKVGCAGGFRGKAEPSGTAIKNAPK